MSEKTAKLHLSERELEMVLQILQKHLPNYSVWAFGSRVKGSMRKYSDLDLAIISETPISLETMGEVREAFSESDLPWKVDLVDWATTSEAFRQIIQQNYIVIQGE